MGERRISDQNQRDTKTKALDDQPGLKRPDRIGIHIKTLDDLVAVNSLFTLAVFVGLSQASPGARSLENRVECNAGPGVAKMLVFYEVVAFSCFLLSSLVAKVLKLHLSLNGKAYGFVKKNFDFKDFMLIVTSGASVAGIILLTLSVVNIVQIRIGLYSCGSVQARRAIWALCFIIGIALIIYVVSMGVGIYASIKGDADNDQAQTQAQAQPLLPNKSATKSQTKDGSKDKVLNQEFDVIGSNDIVLNVH